MLWAVSIFRAMAPHGGTRLIYKYKDRDIKSHRPSSTYAEHPVLFKFPISQNDPPEYPIFFHLAALLYTHRTCSTNCYSVGRHSILCRRVPQASIVVLWRLHCWRFSTKNQHLWRQSTTRSVPRAGVPNFRLRLSRPPSKISSLT